jgi:integrase
MSPRQPKDRLVEPGIRRIVLPSGKERFRVQLGRRKQFGGRRSKLCATYQEAKAFKTEWMLRGLPPKGAPAMSSRHDVIQTVDDGFRHRVLDLEERGKDGSVVERIRVFLKNKWPQGAEMPLHEVTVAVVEDYRDRRLTTPTERRLAGCTNNTVIRELREWRAMLKRAVPGFVLPQHVFPDEDLNRVRMLSPADYTKVFAELAERHGQLFADLAELALLGIMRQADVRLLQRQHVRRAERVLLLPRTKGGPRAVPLSREAMAILTRAMAREPKHEYVFANPYTGKPYSRVHVGRCWRNAARACKLNDFTFHDLRHHGPTAAATNGASVSILKAMGGWKSAKMVERYAHVLDPALHKYLGQIGRARRP